MNKTINEFEKMLAALQIETKKIDQAMRADIESLAGSVDPLLIEVLEYGLFNGGKRIRPVLAVLSARICGYAGDEIYKLAIAFEYLHAATLFHDDVIDNAQTRRGRPAVNRQFGLVSAILAGDFLHARSMDIVGRMTGSEGLRIFCQATAGMVDGEFMQLRNAAQINLSEPDYYEAIMGKTGLLIAASCEIGSLYGGANEKQQKAMREYGVGLGCAFQMVDDLLDYTGDSKKTGKPVGNDLIEGKMTLPLIVSLARAGADDETAIRSIIENDELRADSFGKVVSFIEKHDGFGETRRRAEAAVSDAVAQVELFADKYCAVKDVLISLAGYVLTRQK